MEVPTDSSLCLQSYARLVHTDLFTMPPKPGQDEESVGLGYNVAKQFYDSKEHKELIYLLCYLDFNKEDIEWYIKTALVVSMKVLQLGLEALEPSLTDPRFKHSIAKRPSRAKTAMLVTIAKFLRQKGRLTINVNELIHVSPFVNKEHKGTGLNLKLDSIRSFSGTDDDWIDWKHDTLLALKACSLMDLCTDKAYATANPVKDIEVGAILAKAVTASAAYSIVQRAHPLMTSVSQDSSAYKIWTALTSHYESREKMVLMAKRYKALLEDCKYDEKLYNSDPQEFVLRFAKIVGRLKGWEEGLVDQSTPEEWVFTTFVANMADQTTKGRGAFTLTQQQLTLSNKEEERNFPYACKEMIKAHIQNLKNVPAAKMKHNWKKLRPQLSVNHVQQVGNKEGDSVPAMKSKTHKKPKVTLLPKDIWFKLDDEDKKTYLRTGDKNQLPKEIQEELKDSTPGAGSETSKEQKGDASPTSPKKRPAQHQGEGEAPKKARKKFKKNKREKGGSKVKFSKNTKTHHVSIDDPSTDQDALDTQFSAL